jgi:hypothetical protein
LHHFGERRACLGAETYERDPRFEAEVRVRVIPAREMGGAVTALPERGEGDGFGKMKDEG